MRGWSHEVYEEVLSRGARGAVRLMLEHQNEHASQWAAIGSIAAKIGGTSQTLCNWVRQVERDRGLRTGPTSAEGQAWGRIQPRSETRLKEASKAI